MRNLRAFYLATAATAWAMLAPSVAAAQAGPVQDQRSVELGEVVVTARRAEENLQDVPVSITAVSGEQLRSQNIVQVEDLQKVAPGLIVNNTLRGAAYPAYAIRGQRSAYTATPLNEPAIGLYFAEFSLGAGLGTNSSLYDLASVQVLKGPQGTLFGRNTTGGAVLFTPNRPSDDFEGYVQGTLGDYALRDVEGMVNIPLGEMAALRVAGKLTRRDGFMRNVTTGQETDDRDAEGGRVSLRLNPTESIESTFVASFVRDDSTHGYKLFRVSPRGFTLTLTGNAGPVLGPQLGGLSAGLVQAELAQTQALGRYEYRSPRRLGASARSWMVINTTTVDLGELTFKNIIGYNKAKAASSLDWDGSTVEIFSTDASLTRNEIFSEEFQILGKFGAVDFVAGLFYYHTDDSERAITNILGLLAPVVPPVFPNYSVTQFDSGAESLAGFVHLNWDMASVLEGLSLSGGLRYTRDERTVTWYNVRGSGTPARYFCTSSGAPLPNDGRSPLCAVSDKVTFEEPTWDVSLNYRASPDLLLYAAHRHGYKSGSFNSAPQAFVEPSYDPETIDDVELGLKSDFNLGGVAARFNAAGYYAWYKDIQRQVGRVLPNGAINQVTLNAASADLYGGEAELTLRFSPSLTLNAGYSYTKPKYNKWTDVYPANNIVGSPIITVDISDSSFAFIPRHQFTLALEWRLPVSPDLGEVSAVVNFAGRSSYTTQEITTANCGPDGAYATCLFRGGKLPGYAIANLRVDWRKVGGGRADLAFFVNNLTDRFYRSDSVNALSLGYQAVGVGAPRMVGVELRVPFGAAAE